MKLSQVRGVLAVVDEGGFTKAARALLISQPSLSQSVRALEDELGVALFHRLASGVSLTAAGTAFVGPARAALRDLASAAEAASAVLGLRAGRLDLVALPTLVVDPTVAMIARFRAAHPGVAVHLEEPESAIALREMVVDGHCEIGITDGAKAGDGLITIPLVRQAYLAVMPPGTTGRRRRRIGLANVAHLPLLTTPPGTSTRSLTDQAYAEAGVEPLIAVETTQREALVPLVLAGAGMTLLPEPLATEAAGRGAVVAAVDPPVTRSVTVVRRDAPLSPAAEAFLALAGCESAHPG